MNKLFTKIAGAVIGLTMAVGVGVAVTSNREAAPAHAAVPSGNELLFTINFKDNGTDSSTALTAATFYSSGVTSVTDKNGSTVTSTFSTAGISGTPSKVYPGNGGLKCGSNKNAASFTLNIPSAYQAKFTYAVINCTNATRSITLTAGGGSDTLASGNSSFGDHNLSISSTSTATTLDVSIASASKTAAYIASIAVYKAAAASTPLTGITLGGAASSNAMSIGSSDLTAKTVSVTLNPTTATDQKVNIAHQSGTSGLFTKSASQITCSSGSGSFTITGTGGTSGSETFRISGNTETGVYVDLVVTALDDSVTYWTVSFDSDGGASVADMSVEDGDTFEFPSPGTKTHYSFDGWSSDGGNTLYDAGDESPAVDDDIEYTAYWTEDAKYTVTYSAGTHGTGSYAHTNQYGGTYTLLAFANVSGVSADSGYHFKNYTVGGVNKDPGDTFTLSAPTTVTVNFEEQPPEDVLTSSVIPAAAVGSSTSSWGTASTFSDSTGAVYTGRFMGVSSSSFIGRLNDSANGYIYTSTVPSNMKLKSVSISSMTASKTVGVYAQSGAYTACVTDKSTALGTITPDSLTYTFDSNTSYNAICLRGHTSATEIGTVTITYEAFAVLDSVTTSGQKATFKAGEKFSYGGTLTAHYTAGKADATVTPASYKVGASGIDPTSAGTAITAATTMTIDAHNGKYIYVVYTEDNITKWASYQITVGPADPTGIVLSPSSATIGIDETFSFTDVEVTINPSEYATQNAYEWVMVDDLGLDVEFDYPDIVVHEDSNAEPLIIRCRSTVDNSVYADFELTVSGNPIAVLYDANDEDVTSGSASYYADYGNDIYYHVSATNFGTGVSYTWSSSNSSILSVDDNDGASCGYYIEDGASGTARLSCVISGSKGSATVYVDVTITAVSVSSVTWSAPTIDVFSGATLSASDTSSWNVKYSTNSGKTDQTPDSFNVKFDGSTISLPHTWVAADDGKTLGVEVGGVLSSTVTVKVTQTINSVVAQIPGTPISQYQLVESQSDLEEGRYLIVSIEDAKAFNGSLDTLDAGQNNFDVEITDGTVIANDSTASGKYFDLTVENDAWTITSASGANVGHSASGNGMNGTGTNTITISEGIATILGTGGKGLAYNSASGGTSERFRYYTSPAANTNHSVSLFKLVEEPGTPISTEIANVTAHKEAQRVAVKFAMAFNATMDETENCTTGLDAAWTACESAYNTFKTEAAALGSEKDYAEYYIKYATKQYSDDSGEACIERMMKTYQVMVQKHGKTAFMDDLVSLGATTGRINPLISITNGGNNSVTTILVISLTSLVAIAGYFYFRKREEK